LTTTNGCQPARSELQTIERLSCTFTPGARTITIAYTPPLTGTVKDVTFFIWSSIRRLTGPLASESETLNVGNGIYIYMCGNSYHRRRNAVYIRCHSSCCGACHESEPS
jgi:hypothetical protein